jgi:2Fe-2S ferredoxin
VPLITYLLPDGRAQSVDVPAGQSVMDGSVRNNLPGIVAECGGSCSCATCHVHLRPEYRSRFTPASAEESELVEFLEGADADSRLSCQLIVTPECGGVTVTVADSGG